MKDTYVICANIVRENNTVTGYLATDKASGGYPYFSTSINNSEVRTFDSVELARKFLETDIERCEDRWRPKAAWLQGLVGLRICEVSATNRYFYNLL